MSLAGFGSSPCRWASKAAFFFCFNATRMKLFLTIKTPIFCLSSFYIVCSSALGCWSTSIPFFILDELKLLFSVSILRCHPDSQSCAYYSYICFLYAFTNFHQHEQIITISLVFFEFVLLLAYCIGSFSCISARHTPSPFPFYLLLEEQWGLATRARQARFALASVRLSPASSCRRSSFPLSFPCGQSLAALLPKVPSIARVP